MEKPKIFHIVTAIEMALGRQLNQYLAGSQDGNKFIQQQKGIVQANI
jgi:hypothetical protein